MENRGACVGIFVVEVEGLEVGELDVGTCVGCAIGKLLGDIVGDIVVNIVGDIDGESVVVYGEGI